MSSSSTDPGFRSADADAPAERSVDLLRDARAGDAAALDRLLRRYVPALRRWAHGRLPRWAREMLETDDLVQESVVRTLRHVGEFEPERVGALNVYLRKALRNCIRDEMRRVHRHGSAVTAGDAIPDAAPTPLEALVGSEAVEDFERGLEALQEDQREAIVARIEFGLTYQEIAEQLGKPSADAARMLVARALVRLARSMTHDS
jgi:RNA polymerase sigma-70 factor (ECF subfamily)